MKKEFKVGTLVRVSGYELLEGEIGIIIGVSNIGCSGSGSKELGKQFWNVFLLKFNDTYPLNEEELRFI
ncbi:MAG: hypothetical protein Q8P81_03545 [Nanoarchaeota archaeon]|nr:hypothetical protein [Nanoarchaeota archaeon]